MNTEIWLEKIWDNAKEFHYEIKQCNGFSYPIYTVSVLRRGIYNGISPETDSSFLERVKLIFDRHIETTKEQICPPSEIIHKVIL